VPTRQLRRIRPQYRTRGRVRPQGSRARPVVRDSQLARKRLLDLAWWLGLVVFVGVVFWLVRWVFVIRQVRCIINSRAQACSQSLQDISQTLIGKPMLFYNVVQDLSTIKSPSVDFDSIQYYKMIPDRIVIDWQFPRARYQVAIAEGDWRSYATDGRYTLAQASASGQLLQVRSYYVPFNQLLGTYQTDPIIHQKLLELDYYSEGKRDQWQAVSLISLTELRIDTGLTVYVVDLFDLDRELQKMWYLERNYRHTKRVQIDLRFHSPMLRPLEN